LTLTDQEKELLSDGQKDNITKNPRHEMARERENEICFLGVMVAVPSSIELLEVSFSGVFQDEQSPVKPFRCSA
jgi:hypothetical protein